MRLLAALFLIAVPCLATWQYRATVTFPAASGSTTLTDWTGAFTGSDVKLKTVANGGLVQNTVTRLGVTVPADLAFSSDSSCASITGYNWDIEAYDGTAGTITGWVKLTLTTGAAVVPTVCLGNSSISTWQGGSQGSAYDTNTILVYHFGNSSTLNLNDFSASGSNGTNTGSSAAAGEIAGGVSFNGTSNSIDGGINSNLTGLTEFTVESWFNGVNLGTNFPRIVAKGAINSSGFALFWNGSVLSWQVCPVGCVTVNTASVTSGFHQIAGTYSTTSGIQHLYLDGTNTQNTNAGSLSTTASDLFVGAQPGSSSWYGGTMDEVRVSNVARTLDWINNNRGNQSSPPVISAFTVAPQIRTAPAIIF